MSHADLMITDRRLAQFQDWSLYDEVNMPVNLFQSNVHKVNESGIILPGKKTILRDETDDYLSSLPKHDYRPVIESDFISSVVRSVIDGYGVAFLPTHYMLEPMEQGLVIRAGPKRGFWSHSLYIYWKNQESWSGWLKQFLKNILEG